MDKPNSSSLYLVTKTACLVVILASISSCCFLAIKRSKGLSAVTVTALLADEEPKDHEVPFIKAKEALPDYRLVIRLNSGKNQQLATNPNQSAVDGISWQLAEPISLASISSVRLEDEDEFLSDVIQEVDAKEASTTKGNYQFDFQYQQSFSAGINAFFQTPIGIAICSAFMIAILIMLAPILSAFV